MGLTIHHKLSLSGNHRESPIAVMQRLHANAAQRYPAGSEVQVHPTSTDLEELDRWGSAFLIRTDPDDPDTVRGIAVTPIEGCLFPVSIGNDCEPLWLGLCRYPATVRHDDQDVATDLGSGWRFSGACKTQYASLHGWEYFRRCHTTVIDLLRMAVGVGIRVRIMDEGGWWPRRSDAALRRAIELNNQLVAAMAGALKDDSPDGEPRVVSPIFEHPGFERLEAEGIARKGKSVEQAAREVAKLRRPPQPE